MLGIQDAIRIVEMIVATLAVLLLGNYLGYRIGRWRLAAIAGLVALVSIVGFTAYAAIVFV